MAERTGQVTEIAMPTGNKGKATVGGRVVWFWKKDKDDPSQPSEARRVLEEAADQEAYVHCEGQEWKADDAPADRKPSFTAWAVKVVTKEEAERLGGSPNGGAPAPTGKAAAQFDEEGVAIGWAVNVATQMLGPGCEIDRYLEEAKRALGWRFLELRHHYRALKQDVEATTNE